MGQFSNSVVAKFKWPIACMQEIRSPAGFRNSLLPFLQYILKCVFVTEKTPTEGFTEFWVHWPIDKKNQHLFDSRVFHRKIRESLPSVRWLLWRTQHALPASCSSRLLLLLHSLVFTLYSFWMKLPSDEFAQLDISAKWLERVEVCTSPSTECVHFYSSNEGICWIK